MAQLRRELPFHRDRLDQSPSSAALRDGGAPRLLWFNFAHLFSVSLLPLSTAWMAVSELRRSRWRSMRGILPGERDLCIFGWELIAALRPMTCRQGARIMRSDRS